MRKFIQSLIDRRFYRSKYDAQKTMETFATSARNETDLERLSEELLLAIQGIVQPLHISLWMKPISRVGNW